MVSVFILWTLGPMHSNRTWRQWEHAQKSMLDKKQSERTEARNKWPVPAGSWSLPPAHSCLPYPGFHHHMILNNQCYLQSGHLQALHHTHGSHSQIRVHFHIHHPFPRKVVPWSWFKISTTTMRFPPNLSSLLVHTWLFGLLHSLPFYFCIVTVDGVIIMGFFFHMIIVIKNNKVKAFFFPDVVSVTFKILLFKQHLFFHIFKRQL